MSDSEHAGRTKSGRASDDDSSGEEDNAKRKPEKKPVKRGVDKRSVSRESAKRRRSSSREVDKSSSKQKKKTQDRDDSEGRDKSRKDRDRSQKEDKKRDKSPKKRDRSNSLEKRERSPEPSSRREEDESKKKKTKKADTMTDSKRQENTKSKKKKQDTDLKKSDADSRSKDGDAPKKSETAVPSMSQLNAERLLRQQQKTQPETVTPTSKTSGAPAPVLVPTPIITPTTALPTSAPQSLASLIPPLVSSSAPATSLLLPNLSRVISESMDEVDPALVRRPLPQQHPDRNFSLGSPTLSDTQPRFGLHPPTTNPSFPAGATTNGVGYRRPSVPPLSGTIAAHHSPPSMTTASSPKPIHHVNGVATTRSTSQAEPPKPLGFELIHRYHEETLARIRTDASEHPVPDRSAGDIKIMLHLFISSVMPASSGLGGVEGRNEIPLPMPVSMDKHHLMDSSLRSRGFSPKVDGELHFVVINVKPDREPKDKCRVMVMTRSGVASVLQDVSERMNDCMARLPRLEDEWRGEHIFVAERVTCPNHSSFLDQQQKEPQRKQSATNEVFPSNVFLIMDVFQVHGTRVAERAFRDRFTLYQHMIELLNSSFSFHRATLSSPTDLNPKTLQTQILWKPFYKSTGLRRFIGDGRFRKIGDSHVWHLWDNVPNDWKASVAQCKMHEFHCDGLAFADVLSSAFSIVFQQPNTIKWRDQPTFDAVIHPSPLQNGGRPGKIYDVFLSAHKESAQEVYMGKIECADMSVANSIYETKGFGEKNCSIVVEVSHDRTRRIPVISKVRSPHDKVKSNAASTVFGIYGEWMYPITLSDIVAAVAPV